MTEEELRDLVKDFIEKGINSNEVLRYAQLELINGPPKQEGGEYHYIRWVSKEGNFEFYESSSAKVIRGIKIDVDLNISLEKYTLSSLQLEDCSFKHLFVEKHGGISNLTIKIDKCSIGNLVLFGTYIQEVCLKNSFLNRMHSHYISAKEVELIDCSGSLDFGAPEGNSELFDVIIKGGDYESISLQNHEKSSITLTGVKCKTPIVIDGRLVGKKRRLRLKSLIILDSITDLRIYHLDFDHLIIKDIVHQGRSTFKEISTKNLEVSNLINLGRLIFFNLNDTEIDQPENSILNISDSALGNTQFINSSLDSFSKAAITNVDLSEMKVVNSKWPTDINSDDLSQKVGVYRQLKLVMTNSGDREMELLFYQVEMDSLLQLENKDRWKRFNLWLSKHTNNFGQDYVKPIRLYFWLSVALYLITLLLTYYKEVYRIATYAVTHFQFLTIDWDKINLYLIKYVEFMTPISNVYLFEDISFPSAILVFLSKVIFGFLIYQTITAFRRLYRK